jgi:predicted PurR-regulated permease PerM
LAARAGDPGAKVRRVQLAPGLAAVVITVFLLWLARAVAPVLLLLFLAILLAVYLDALRDTLVARARLTPRLAFAGALLITFAVAGGVVMLIIPAVVDQTRALIARLPDIAIGWEQRLTNLVDRVPALEPFIGAGRRSEMVTSAVGQAEEFLGGLLPRVFDLLHGFINVASVLVMALYLALNPAMYKDFFVAVTPPRYRPAASDVLAALGVTLRAWSLAQLLAMAVLGVLTALGLWLLSVPYYLTFGIFTGVAAIVPFFGTLVSTIVPALFVLGGEGGAAGALLVLLLGIVVHLIEGNFVAPLIMERHVKLPPVFSIMAVLIVGRLMGPVGLLVAVPTLAVVMVLVRKVLIERIYQERATAEARREDAELALAESSGEVAPSPGR